jgi:hypothetical protein
MAYNGKPDLSGQATLELSRDEVRFDGRFRPTAIATWMTASAANPLPPIDGHLVAPRIDIAGATLQGVDVTLDDSTLADPPMP